VKIHVQLSAKYRVAQKKRTELCLTIRARILYTDKFPSAHL